MADKKKIAAKGILKKKDNRRRVSEADGLVRVRAGVDRPFLLLVLILVAIGTIMVFSASYAYAKENYDDSYFFASRQIRWVLFGSGVMFVMSYFDYLIIRRFQKLFFAFSMVMMAIVPFFGYEAGGATRWFQFGSINFQPSEFAKIAIILFFADYIARDKGVGKSIIGQVLPYLAVGGYMAITLVLEPHISCCIIVLLLIFVLMIFGGVPKKVIFLLAIAGVVLVGLMILISSHARERIMVWLNPAEHTKEGGWQPLQSLYAIGSGGFWGVGLGQSTQKHLYLPEPQNDYIFSILCEELGFIFAAGVIILFVALVWRGIYIAKHAPSTYACLVVVGIVAQVAIQVLLNIAVVTNTFPSTGIPLPFFSYGGTSLIILMAEMGMILNISRYSYIEKG